MTCACLALFIVLYTKQREHQRGGLYVQLGADTTVLRGDECGSFCMSGGAAWHLFVLVSQRLVPTFSGCAIILS